MQHDLVEKRKERGYRWGLVKRHHLVLYKREERGNWHLSIDKASDSWLGVWQCDAIYLSRSSSLLRRWLVGVDEESSATEGLPLNTNHIYSW